MVSWRLRAADVAGLLAAGVPALWQLSLLFRLYLARFRYPMDLEWLEGAVLYQAHRVMTGLATYDPPSQGYLPIFHPPGYPTLLGLIGRVIGVDYPMARTVSLGCFAVASALVVRQLTRSRIDGILSFAMGLWAVGCAAAGVPLMEGFYDLIREDVLALLFAVIGAVIAESDGRWRWWFGTGHRVRPEHASFARIAVLSLVCAAIVYTRLPYVFFVVWIVLFVLWRNPKEGMLLALGVTSVCGLVLVLLQYATRGYYWMYTFAVVQDHTVHAARFKYGLDRIVEFAPFVPALPVVAVALALARRLSAQTVLWLGMFASAIPSALLPFAKVGGFSNDFMPAAFFIGPATAWLVLDGVRALGRHPRVQAIVVTLVYAGLGAFLLVRTYDLKPFVPSDDMRRLARTLNSRVLNLDGEVIAPRHPFVPVRNGKHSRQYAEMPYLDGAWAGWSNLDLGAYVERLHARYALVTGNEIALSAGEIGARYQLDQPLEAPGMLIGERSTLRYVLRWQDDEKDARILFDFEDAKLDGWTRDGSAFAQGPTTARPDHQNRIFGIVGQRVANSYEPVLGDRARGRLTSPPFLIDRSRMAVRVGGGWRASTRVELHVDGQVERTATGIFQQSESLVRVVWDVAGFLGKEGRVVLVDEDEGPWGHLLCDQVVLY